MPIFAALLPILNEWLTRLFPDPEERARQMQQLVETAQAADAAQMEVNKVEASNPNIFVSGWRPFIGWVCGIAFAYHFVFQPLLAFALANAGHPVNLPAFDMDELTTVLMGMLGLGGLRTIEKVKGTK